MASGHTTTIICLANSGKPGVCTAEYTWTHCGSYRTSFPAAFIRILTRKPINSRSETIAKSGM